MLFRSIEYGTTVEQLAEIAVSTRYNAGFNPEAFYRDPITIDEVNVAALELLSVEHDKVIL